MQDKVLERVLWLLLVLREHARIVLDIHLSHLRFKVSDEGIDSEACLVNLAAKDPERCRQALTLTVELFRRFVKQVCLFKEHDVAFLIEEIIIDNKFHVMRRFVHENIAGLKVIDGRNSQAQIKKRI